MNGKSLFALFKQTGKNDVLPAIYCPKQRAAIFCMPLLFPFVILAQQSA